MYLINNARFTGTQESTGIFLCKTSRCSFELKYNTMIAFKSAILIAKGYILYYVLLAKRSNILSTEAVHAHRMPTAQGCHAFPS